MPRGRALRRIRRRGRPPLRRRRRRVSREGDLIAHPPAKQIADRLADGLADEIQAGDLEGRVGAGRGVERVFARDQVGLRAVVSPALSLDHRRKEAAEPIRVCADDLRTQRFELLDLGLAAVGFRDADDAFIAFQFHDGAQGVRRMEAV